jgi:hypothetical protein
MQGKWKPNPLTGQLVRSAVNGNYWSGRGAHLAIAALRAICWRFLGESFAARAGPPFLPPRRPSSTAAGFFSRVASAVTRNAASFTSSDRCLLERFGMGIL